MEAELVDAQEARRREEDEGEESRRELEERVASATAAFKEMEQVHMLFMEAVLLFMQALMLSMAELTPFMFEFLAVMAEVSPDSGTAQASTHVRCEVSRLCPRVADTNSSTEMDYGATSRCENGYGAMSLCKYRGRV
eukprot:2533349-Rhodomonas_salina.2